MKDKNDRLKEKSKTGDYVIIKPRQHLGSKNFARIASIVLDLEGSYIIAGSDSHFRIRKR